MTHDKKKVFVVDDSSPMQQIAKRILAKNNYDAIPVWSGEECLKRAWREQPDAILMDVMLPDGDGKEFTLRLSEDERTKHIPVIFATNMISLDEDKGCAVYDINGTYYRAFAKPMHEQKIASVIKKEIGRKMFGGDLPKNVYVVERVELRT